MITQDCEFEPVLPQQRDSWPWGCGGYSRRLAPGESNITFPVPPGWGCVNTLIYLLEKKSKNGLYHITLYSQIVVIKRFSLKIYHQIKFPPNFKTSPPLIVV